jgi:uncharacterized SAM-binding protein YcdF (DUF218 family)
VSVAQTAADGEERVRLPGAAGPARRRLPLLRLLAVASAAVLSFLCGGFLIFSNHVSHLVTPSDPAAADAIIVLTGGQARIDAAVSLLEQNKGGRLLISGVHPAADRAALSRATGASRRLFACCVDIDHAALDTIGNAEQSAKWVKRHAYRRVILVTNNYHMPRSLLEVGRLVGPQAELLPYPVVNAPIDAGRWMVRPGTLRLLASEYAKYLAALARGVLPVAPDSPHSAQTAAAPASSVSR